MEERLRHAAQGAEMVREAGEATQEEKRSRLTEMGLQSGFHVLMLSKPGAPDSGDEDEARALTDPRDREPHDFTVSRWRSTG